MSNDSTGTIDWRVVFESPSQVICNEHALVLAARQLPFRVVHDPEGYCVIVPAEHSIAAVRELSLYAEENRPARKAARQLAAPYNPLPGIAGYLFVLLTVTWLAGESFFARDWYAAGGIDGGLVRDGEVWRLVTALTLHADGMHLFGNLVFGAVFGLFAGRLLGSGVAWLAILSCAVAGNLANTFLLSSLHRSIGASTAVFAALGIVTGYVWHGRLLPQERWTYRYGPLVGGIALLAYTGAGGGDPERNVDVGAHLLGFVCGLLGGMVLVHVPARWRKPGAQVLAGLAALLAIALAWTVALR